MLLRTLPPFQLERWFAEYEFVPGIQNLAASCPFSVTTQELLKLEGPESTEQYLALGLDYIENPGAEELRQGIARLFATLQAEHIRATSGASEALSLLIWSAVEAGQNIIVEQPCYENITGTARSLGIEIRKLPLRMEDGWRPDLERLSRLIDRKTGLIYLNHPHNPTGSILHRAEMQALGQMAERVGALLVNDEVFRLAALDGEVMPSLVDVVEGAVSIGDMTKPWGLGGLRVGWIASKNRDLLARISMARDYTTMCSSAPGEFLARIVLRHPAEVIEPRLQAARTNRAALEQTIRQSEGALAWMRPSAGYTAFLRFPFATTEFCRKLAQERRILLLPGEVYGEPFQNYLRIGYGCGVQKFQNGLSIIMEEFRNAS